MKMITPETLAASGTEHGHQSALFCWAASYYAIFPRIRYMFAIPNGGARSKATAGNLKAEGVKRGVPDVMLPIPIGNCAGLFIEMKKPKKEGGRVSEHQDDMRNHLVTSGYRVVLCYSWIEARDEILRYIGQS